MPHKLTEAEVPTRLFIRLSGSGFFIWPKKGFAISKKAFMLSWHMQVMDKVVFCKDCNHKAGEHGVFEDSDANEPHPCMRSDCGCNRYVPSE
ncbi:MAG: hypothetical protein M3M88_07885 [Thermoproteota archaeon]|nr:hypothetical protein [Thermoproteota archaeon]